MHPRKQKKLSVAKTGPKSDSPANLFNQILVRSAMLASDSRDCWRKCEYRSCRIEHICQGEEFAMGNPKPACAGLWTDEQMQRFLGALNFGMVYLLPKLPDEMHDGSWKPKPGEPHPYDVDLVILHKPRGSEVDYQFFYPDEGQPL
jgi:hypothetical protein